jgi:hypothetical protein
MSSAFDSRLIEVDIVLPDATLTFTQDFAIYANGQKFFSTNAAVCECRIFNLTPSQRNQIITLASPLKQPRTKVLMNVKVGRVSTGLSLLYTGQVILADVMQPPDIGIVLRSLANNFLTGQIENVQYAANSSITQIAEGTAKAGGWNLNNQCTSKTINNFGYTGTPLDGVEKLNQMGAIQACVDNGTLIITDASKAVNGAAYVLNSSTGMVGIPQVTDQGVIVKMMINNTIQIGGSVTVQSTTNQAANGTYKIMQIEYEIASRDQPFWYTLVCSNLGLFNGTQG